MRFARRPSSHRIRLVDVYSRVFFTPEGDMLDVPSNEDLGLNVTLSSITSSENRAHTPFPQYAVLGGKHRRDGRWRPLQARWSVSTSSARVKQVKILKVQHGGESGGTGGSVNACLFETPGGVIGRGATKMAGPCYCVAQVKIPAGRSV